MTAIAESVGRYCPSCNRQVRRAFDPGPDGRPDAECPKCQSLERHRFFSVLLGALAPRLGEVGVLLDIAPAPQSTKPLKALQPRHYVRMDIRRARGVHLRGSLTEMPLADGVVDLLVCYHVLEHIRDDRAAMREIARVLSDDGIGILQVPWRPGTVTDEDPDAPPEERKRRFGLTDHLRYYGDDVEDRLVEAGLSVERYTPETFLGAEMATWMHLGQEQSVWLVRRAAAGSTRAAEGRHPLSVTLDTVVAELAKPRQERDAARARVRRLLASQKRHPEPAPPRSVVRRVGGRIKRQLGR